MFREKNSILPWMCLLLLLFSRSVLSHFCNSMDCSTPGFHVHHQLPELAQTHVHHVSDGHPTISSSVIPFSCPQSFPASGSFPMSQPFASGGQSIGLSQVNYAFPGTLVILTCV